MKRRGFITAVIIVVVAGAITTYFWPSQIEKPNTDVAGQYSLDKTVQYSFVVRNPLNTSQSGTFWTYAPVARTAYQTVKQIKTSHPYQLETDNSGNQRLMFDLGKLPPYGTRHVDIRVVLGFAEQPATRIPPNESALGQQAFVEVDHPEIQALAKTLDAEPLTEAVFQQVRQTVTNSGYTAADRGALHALKTGKGDCSEHMYLYMALARAKQLPTHGMSGFVIKHSGVLKARDYHNWVQVWQDDHWQVIDPDKTDYRVRPEDYLVMRVLDSTSPFQGDGSQQLFGGDQQLAIAMN